MIWEWKEMKNRREERLGLAGETELCRSPECRRCPDVDKHEIMAHILWSQLVEGAQKRSGNHEDKVCFGQVP